jgi:hypothetical protein
MTALHETEVDGVRCFWVETGRPTLAAALVFRHGLADERFTESGFVHLLEHLSLHGRGSGGLHVNGQVRMLETTFDAHGPADQVVEHLAALTGWLSAPTFEELDRERLVLGAEAAVRGEGPTTRAMSWRFGAQGPGVVTYGEPGLGRATAELLTDRAHQVFTQGNAVLALDGAPPPGLRLVLPAGALLPVATAVSVESQFPGMYVEESGLVLSGLVPRGAAMGIGTELLRRQLEDRLRNQQGAAYAPWATYERVDPDSAVVIGGSDIRREALQTLANDTMDLTQALGRTPNLERIAEVKASASQSLRDPYAQFSIAMRAAVATLHGQTAQSGEEVIAELEAVSPHDIVVGMEQFLRTLLVGVPGDTAWQNQMRRLTARTTRPTVKGRRHRSRNWPTDRARLVVGDDVIQLSVGDEARMVSLTEAAGVLAHENGLRHVVGVDGYAVTVNPHDWHAGTRAVRRLDEVTPASKLLPMPAVPGIDQVVRLGVFRRWTGPLRGKVTRIHLLKAALILGGLTVSIGGIAVAVLSDIGGLGIVAGIMGVVLIRAAVDGDD